MAVKHEETNRTYPRYNWWNEMRRGWTEEEHQFVPLTFGQVEMLQRNRLAFLLETQQLLLEYQTGTMGGKHEGRAT